MEIKVIVNSFIELFFPMRCINCQDVVQVSQFLCSKCTEILPFTNWRLDKENTSYHRLRNFCRIENCYSLLYFKQNNVTQKILHEMKYKNRPEIGIDLANLINTDLSHYDGIIPIPLHNKRLKIRGYNQIDFFSEQLAKNNNIPYYRNGLVKTLYSSSQVNEDKKNRFNNLQNAFEVNPNLSPGHYILIDDVITTGATLSSAIQKFNSLDNFKISVISIACA